MSTLARTVSIGFAVVATCFLVSGSALADSSEEARAPSEVGTAICGHLDEMKAAQEALRSNDREEAIRHLKEARRLLVACDANLADEEDEKPAISI